ncbi:hypothetical protein J6590_044711 [Homalodisca vitripennis]|nr:hypothetical protein J6590_044711 [Homalodisca vitripennis]
MVGRKGVLRHRGQPRWWREGEAHPNSEDCLSVWIDRTSSATGGGGKFSETQTPCRLHASYGLNRAGPLTDLWSDFFIVGGNNRSERSFTFMSLPTTRPFSSHRGCGIVIFVRGGGCGNVAHQNSKDCLSVWGRYSLEGLARDPSNPPPSTLPPPTGLGRVGHEKPSSDCWGNCVN